MTVVLFWRRPSRHMLGHYLQLRHYCFLSYFTLFNNHLHISRFEVLEQGQIDFSLGPTQWVTGLFRGVKAPSLRMDGAIPLLAL